MRGSQPLRIKHSAILKNSSSSLFSNNCKKWLRLSAGIILAHIIFLKKLRNQDGPRSWKIQQWRTPRTRWPLYSGIQRFREEIFMDAIGVLATSQEGINIWSYACSAMLVRLCQPAAAPMGVVPARAAGEAYMGLQGYTRSHDLPYPPL